MKATLSDYRQSPRKVRMVANLIRGKAVSEVRMALAHLPKRAAMPLLKLVESAAANAKVQGANPDTLKIVKIMVNPGVTLKRMMPRARGSSARINKRSCHVILELGNFAKAKK